MQIPPVEKIATSASLLFNLIPSHSHSVVFAGWTIGVEVIFYMIFPFLFPRLVTVPSLITALLLSFGLSVIFNQWLPHLLSSETAHVWSLIGFLRHFPTFIMGMLLAKIYQKRADKDNIHIGWVLLASSFFLYTALFSDLLTDFLIDHRQWRGVAAALFVAGFIFAPISILTNFTSYIGRISYSIYLMHGIVIKVMGGVFVFVASLGMHEGLSFAAITLIALATIIPVSGLTYRFIELPGIRLSNLAVNALDRYQVKQTSTI